MKKRDGEKHLYVTLHVLVEQNLMLLKLNVRENLTDDEDHLEEDHLEEEDLMMKKR